MVIQEPVQAAIWHALNHYAYSDAVFLAERLYAEVHNDDILHLLASSYYRAEKSPVKAYLLLKNTDTLTPQCKYLLAKCCLDLDKLSEAESTLAGSPLLSKIKSVDDYVTEYGDTACYTLQLLANIYNKTERQQMATEFYKKSLKLNPFLWSSFQNICNTGEKVDASKIFQVANIQMLTNETQSIQTPSICRVIVTDQSIPGNIIQENGPTALSAQIINLTPGSETPSNTDISESTVTPKEMGQLAPPKLLSRVIKHRGGSSLLGGTASLSPLTPSFGVLPLDTPSPGTGFDKKHRPQYITPSPMALGENNPSEVMCAPNKRVAQGARATKSKPPVFSQSGNTQAPGGNPGIQNVRRSSRLFSNANSVKENNNKNQSRGRVNSPKAPAKKYKMKLSKTQELNELNKTEMEPEQKSVKSATTPSQSHMMSLQRQSAAGLVNLLKDMGKAYQALSHYECKKAIDMFSNLPVHHHQTGFVLSQIGKAYFEMAEYQQAAQYFSDVRRVAPHYFDSMETYSTTLWHLQKEVTLSTLAQELTDLDKDSPQAWCATGNCFSLQKEHDVAIKFFQRAVQVDPNFAYAHTLLGHEYVLVEEFDKAMSCFRNAIRIDSRHYNAWYGVGMIYYKQEKFSLAESQLRKALLINPHSSVLMCHVGMVQHALQKPELALTTLSKAIKMDPKNPLCKFHRASILFASEQHKEALQELEELKMIVPKESLVYFLIGKVHKKLGNTHLALINFSWAMDLDPKGANNQIKEAIDKRYVTEEDSPNEVMEIEARGGLPTPGLPANSSAEEDFEQLQAVESDDSF